MAPPAMTAHKSATSAMTPHPAEGLGNSDERGRGLSCWFSMALNLLFPKSGRYSAGKSIASCLLPDNHLNSQGLTWRMTGQGLLGDGKTYTVGDFRMGRISAMLFRSVDRRDRVHEQPEKAATKVNSGGNVESRVPVVVRPAQDEADGGGGNRAAQVAHHVHGAG